MSYLGHILGRSYSCAEKSVSIFYSSNRLGNWLINGTLTGTTTPIPCQPGSNCNEMVTPRSPERHYWMQFRILPKSTLLERMILYLCKGFSLRILSPTKRCEIDFRKREIYMPSFKGRRPGSLFWRLDLERWDFNLYFGDLCVLLLLKPLLSEKNRHYFWNISRIFYRYKYRLQS